jgi:serine O-acetyltransferase
MTDKEHPVDKAISSIGALLDHDIPSALSIWQRAQHYLEAGDDAAAKRCQRLNYLCHNSSIPNEATIGKHVRFAYGGIGMVIHKDSEIREGAAIGSNVTIGGRSGSKFRIGRDGRRLYVPLIDKNAYIATGTSILGGITIGEMAVVGANSVVLDDIPALSVAVGQPAKIVTQITLENAARYKSMFVGMRTYSDDEFRAYVDRILKKTK